MTTSTFPSSPGAKASVAKMASNVCQYLPSSLHIHSTAIAVYLLDVMDHIDAETVSKAVTSLGLR